MQLTRPRVEYMQEPGETVRYVVGVDLGQSVDSTAISVVEHRITREGVNAYKAKVRRHDTFALRHLERIPLGTSYVDQAVQVGGLMKTAPIRDHGTLVIDQTGVGRPVLDIFKEHGLNPVGISITAGDAESRSQDGWRVPKLQLVSRLQAILHSGDLQIAAGLAEGEALKAELADFRVSYSQGSGYARFAAREGRHDDLVLSLAIAVWWAARPDAKLQVSRIKGLM